MLTLLVCLCLPIFASSQTTATSKGFSDTNCQTQIGTTGTVIIAPGGTCGAIAVGQVTVTGVATINGNTATLQGCSPAGCASSTACTANQGAPITITNGVCTSAASIGFSGSFTTSWSSGGSSGSCFHEDTEIMYNNENLSLAQLQHHTECVIPHLVTAVGNIIHAECGTKVMTLRLTSGHLVYTQRGLQAAKDITTSDVVFSDLKEQHSCKVLKVDRETSTQKYFGLNCFNSQVLASGIKASTFEKLHSVPSFWMAIMGRVLGIKRASQYGDYIEQFASKMNLV